MLTTARYPHFCGVNLAISMTTLHQRQYLLQRLWHAVETFLEKANEESLSKVFFETALSMLDNQLSH